LIRPVDVAKLGSDVCFCFVKRRSNTVVRSNAAMLMSSTRSKIGLLASTKRRKNQLVAKPGID
jgi:hypothetical protein